VAKLKSGDVSIMERRKWRGFSLEAYAEKLGKTIEELNEKFPPLPSEGRKRHRKTKDIIYAPDSEAENTEAEGIEDS